MERETTLDRHSDMGQRDLVDDTRQKGGELMLSAQQQVSRRTDEIRGETMFQLREQVQQRSTQAGEQVEAMGQALRSGSERLRSEGKGSSATVLDKVAQSAENLGSYLQSADADRIFDDVESFARRRPWLSAGAAALAGFVASRLVKASSDRRYEDQMRGTSAYPRRSLAAGAGE